jgi:antitoxin VapB
LEFNIEFVWNEPQHQRSGSAPTGAGDLPRRGVSTAHVVTDALRERFSKLERRSSRASLEELLAIADEAAAHLKRLSVDHVDLLYDENGLPK